MIKALIQNGDDRTLLLTLPSTRMKLAGSLTYLGINKPASDISCLADDENGISVKLFGDDAVDNKIIQAVKADTSLATLNTACASSTRFRSPPVSISAMRYTTTASLPSKICSVKSKPASRRTAQKPSTAR